MTAPEKERTGSGDSTIVLPAHAASQAEGLRALLSIAVDRAEDLLDELAEREGQEFTQPQEVVPEVDEAPASLPESVPESPVGRPRRAGRVAGGRHAAPPTGFRRRGSRFLVFSTIGGTVFLMGFGLQAVLTGMLHMLPVGSYLIQAVASVEASFLLNRWLTWRDRSTPFWSAFARFNAQKTVTITLNLALYAGLIRLGMNYLVANVALTVAFTVVNYVAGDRLVFIPGRARPAEPAAVTVPDLAQYRPPSPVSVVIPCRNNERTIRAAVQSLLDQDYPALSEIILIGSPGDRTWNGLAGIYDSRLTIWELETPPGLRDANFKRNAAIRQTSGDLIALVDSDIVLPPDWISRAVTALEDSGTLCVTGGMKSAHDSFWGRYTDSTFIGAKTPRIAESYTVTSADFGARGRKPPITANTLFTRDLYDHCPIDPSWSHGSYEDYEWFWRVTKAGYRVFVCQDLFGWHEHRRGWQPLAKEYKRSSRGCAYFIRAHRDCPLAKRRLRQVITLPLVAIVGAVSVAALAAAGHGPAMTALALACAAVLAVHQVARSRRLESLAYPAVGLVLGAIFTAGLAMNLIRSGPVQVAGSGISALPTGSERAAEKSAIHPRRRFPYSVVMICAVQAALSLTLVWSNTAYIDEADYLWVGRLEISHWIHGTSWPFVYAYEHLSGTPIGYPAIGALAASAGGIAGARVLSLGLMLASTFLLYLTACRLIGRTGAIFAAALWGFSEPAMRLAFAVPDPLSVFLTAFSAWLIMQAGYRRHRGEFIAAAAVVLALANVVAYSGIFIDPVVIAFGFLAWLNCMRPQQALSCAAWLTAAWLLFFGMLMTFSHSWLGFFSTVIGSNVTTSQGLSATLSQIWAYAGVIIGLALIGGLISLRSDKKSYVVFVGGLAFAIFVLSQFSHQTVWSLDSHLAYGIWFAAISAGYACSRLIQWLPSTRKSFAFLCCVAAFAYPAAISWQAAWQRYHAWPDASTFISALKPIASNSRGFLYLPAHEANIAEYYTPQVTDWTRWNGKLSLDPVAVPHGSWSQYYTKQLRSRDYGVIALFYSTTFSSVKLNAHTLLLLHGSRRYQTLLGLVGNNSGEPGLSALTLALEADHHYHLAAVGRYNTRNISGTHGYGVYAIWQKGKA